MRRHPLEDRELAEWLQRQAEEPAPARLSPHRRVLLLTTACLALWAILILAAIGIAALFGVQP